MGRQQGCRQRLQVASAICLLLATEAACAFHLKPRRGRKDAQVEVATRIALGDWGQTQEDLAVVDTGIYPDYWEPQLGMLLEIDPRVPTNGAEPPEQLVKVTDRRHKFPVFATICSISFLATVITLLIVCTS